MTGKSEHIRKEEPQKQQQGNLGQKEAELEQRSEGELARMGEHNKSKRKNGQR